MKNTRWTAKFIALVLPALAGAGELYVSTTGSDDGAGTKESPLRTVQVAVDRMKEGDVCFLREGTYHEELCIQTSGIRIEAYPGEEVVFDGTDSVQGSWQLHSGAIYKITIPKATEQLFVGREMMIEARWPNMTFEQRFNRGRWAQVDMGSTHGKIFSEEIAQSGIDWTGAAVCLNVGHQWWTWNRTITRHEAGSNTLEYDADLVGLCNYDPEFGMEQDWLDKKWGDDYFYLFGKLEALDAEREWYFDSETGTLYFHAPNGENPNGLEVKYKTGNYAVYAKNRECIQLRGINFFATTFLLEDCNSCLIEDCEMLYPTWSRTITEYDQERRESVITKIVGDHNTVRRCSLAYANNMGLMVMGNSNLVENCIIHDVNWYGTLIYPALQFSGSPHLGVNWFDTIQYPPTERTIQNSDVTSYGNVAASNTLYNGGSCLLVYQAAESLIEYCHMYDGGLACKDVSLVYGCWPFAHSSIARYNWVHGCRTDGKFGRGGNGGMGLRADDQSRKNVFHHNVVWDCGRKGIVVKGEDHLVYNNTVFNIGTPDVPELDLLIYTEAEPIKVWAVQWPQLQRQNYWTEAFNNISRNIVYTQSNTGILPDSDRIHHNFRGKDPAPYLRDPSSFDFSPLKDSPLVDAGVVIPGYTDGFKGAAPDLGAYELGGEHWIPGASWNESFSNLQQ